MAMPKGTYLCAIRDIESLRLRCVINEMTGCWRYRGCTEGKQAKLQIVLPDGTRRVMRGRQAAWVLKHGRPIPPGTVTMPRPRCGGDCCVNPDHVAVGPRKKAIQVAAQRGAFDTPEFRLALHKTQQGKRKISLAGETALRLSKEPLAEAAARLGISYSYARDIRAGVVKGGLHRVASVFDWRPT